MPTLMNMRHNYRFRFHLSLLLICAVTSACSTTPICRAQDTVATLTQQEKFVLDKVVPGECVTFSDEGQDVEKDICPKAVFAKGYDHTIRSKFIEALLTDNFKGFRLTRPMVIDGATFHGRLSVRNAKIPVELRLTNGQFDDDVDLSTSHFPAPLFLSGSKFTNAAANLNFNSMEVAGGLFLDDVEIRGNAGFYHLRVKGDVFLRRALFTKESGTAQFGEADIEGDMFVQDSTFKGSFSIAQSTLKGLKLENTAVAGTLDLGHARVERVLELSLTGKPRHVIVAGLNYGDLEPGGVDVKLSTLIDSEKNKDYDAQSYSQLEDYYRLHGFPERADAVFIHRKQIERGRLSWPANWFSWLVELLVGYGRKPQRALYISLAIVLLGTAIFFLRRNMQLQDPKSSRKDYNPFWYSLDLLTPFIDLDAAKVWMPRETWWFGRNYARLHRILGWILVPIGVAAITGIIK